MYLQTPPLSLAVVSMMCSAMHVVQVRGSPVQKASGGRSIGRVCSALLYLHYGLSGLILLSPHLASYLLLLLAPFNSINYPEASLSFLTFC